MSVTQRSDQIDRDAILKLLSDVETAIISMDESSTAMDEGSEYLDLQNLGAGVQLAKTDTRVAMGHVLCRRSVSVGTWSRILDQLKH